MYIYIYYTSSVILIIREVIDRFCEIDINNDLSNSLIYSLKILFTHKCMYIVVKTIEW